MPPPSWLRAAFVVACCLHSSWLRAVQAVQLHIEVSHGACAGFSPVASTTVSLNYTGVGDAGEGTGHAQPDCGAFSWNYSSSDGGWQAPWRAASMTCNEDGSSSVSFFASLGCGSSNAVDVDGKLTRELMQAAALLEDGLPGANVSLGGTVLVTTAFPLPATHMPGDALASLEGVCFDAIRPVLIEPEIMGGELTIGPLEEAYGKP